MEDLLKLARKGKLDQVESAWMQALEQETVPWQALLEAAKALVSREAGTAESLLWYLITALRERGDLRAAFVVASRACALLPESDSIREETAEVHMALHGRSARTEALVKMTVGDERIPLGEAIQRLEHLQKLDPGTYVREDPGAKFGRVEGLDPEGRKLVVAFAQSRAEYDAAAAQSLRIVPQDDFRALLLFERERLEALAEEEPEELVALVLRTFGPRVSHVRFRRQVQLLLGADRWAKWWSGAKQAIEHSAAIGLSEGKKPDLFLRSRPVPREERLRAEFDAASVLDKMALALRLLGESPGDREEHRGLLEHFAREIAALAASSVGTSGSVALAGMAVLEAIERQAPDVRIPRPVVPDDWLESMDLVEVLATELAETEVLGVVMAAIPGWAPGRWCEVYARAMPRLGKDACRQAARRLAAAGRHECLSDAVRQTLRRPDSHSGALVWLWKAWETEEASSTLAESDRRALLRQLLRRAASLRREEAGPAEQRRRLLGQIRQAILSEGSLGVRKALEGADDTQVAEMLSLVEGNPGLSEQARGELAKLVRGSRPELFRTTVPPWEEEVIYTTAEGLKKRQEQMRRIVHERLPEVFREIGEAAGFGDLSDNAEYTAALEERARLAHKTTEIQDELARARLITREMAQVPHVTVGSLVRARNLESGELEMLKFLGPWDAEPAAGVYSYKAPLSRAFMGRGVGETVVFSGADAQRRWEIVEVAPAL